MITQEEYKAELVKRIKVVTPTVAEFVFEMNGCKPGVERTKEQSRKISKDFDDLMQYSIEWLASEMRIEFDFE